MSNVHDIVTTERCLRRSELLGLIDWMMKTFVARVYRVKGCDGPHPQCDLLNAMLVSHDMFDLDLQQQVLTSN